MIRHSSRAADLPPAAPAPPPALRRLTALLVPADPSRPIEPVETEDSARSYSDLIGGGLLEDVTAVLAGGDAVTFYLDERRLERCLPTNPRAAALAARLGVPPSALRTTRGDVVVTGMDRHGSDTDVPPVVVTAATRLRLVSPPRPTRAGR